MVRIGNKDVAPDDSDGSDGGRLVNGDGDGEEREQDPVSSLRDTEEEAGDEEGLRDSLTLDTREAKDLGADLDPTGGQESELD